MKIKLSLGHCLGLLLTLSICTTIGDEGTYRVNLDWKSASVPDRGPVASVAWVPPTLSTPTLGSEETAVSNGGGGRVVLFQRAERRLSKDAIGKSYSLSVGNGENIQAINSSTIYIVDATTGKILLDWGQDLFFMPHGLTVADNGDVFTTDVLLHQVFKFSAGSKIPTLVLGTRLEQGKDDQHFCGPTAVAVLSNGDFFVSDGYCNSRIIKFNSDGQILWQIGTKETPPAFQSSHGGKAASDSDHSSNSNNSRISPDSFNIVHDLALAEDQDLLCAADRENGRIPCFRASSGAPVFTIEAPEFGGRVFSIAHSPVDGGTIFAINAPTGMPGSKVQVFVIPLSTKKVSAVFSPPCNRLKLGHGISVTEDGSTVFISTIAPPGEVWKFQRSESPETEQSLARARLVTSEESLCEEKEDGTNGASPIVFSSIAGILLSTMFTLRVLLS